MYTSSLNLRYSPSLISVEAFLDRHSAPACFESLHCLFLPHSVSILGICNHVRGLIDRMVGARTDWLRR